jgi:hypothetical protein
MIIRVVGVAAVYDDHDQLVTERELLQQFDAFCYDAERFTDYLGGPPHEDDLAKLLTPGGKLRFVLADQFPLLTALTEYEATRKLSESELKLLLDYTIGQWSDGIGENIATETGIQRSLSVQCQTNDPVPTIEQIIA